MWMEMETGISRFPVTGMHDCSFWSSRKMRTSWCMSWTKTKARPGGMVIQDVDSDGFPDVLATSYDENQIFIYFGAEEGDYPLGVIQEGGIEVPEEPGTGTPAGEGEQETTGDSGSVFAPGPFAVNAFAVNQAPVAMTAYIPEMDGTLPVVFLNHGFMLSAGYYTEMAEHIASHGFAVFTPQTHEAGGLPFGKPTVTEEILTALDVFDWVLSNGAAAIGENLNTDEVVVVGHSRGAEIGMVDRPESPPGGSFHHCIGPGGQRRSLHRRRHHGIGQSVATGSESHRGGNGIGEQGRWAVLSALCTGGIQITRSSLMELLPHPGKWSCPTGATWTSSTAIPRDVAWNAPNAQPGGNPTGGRLLAAGLTIAAAKGDLNGDDAAWDLVSDSSEHPVSTSVQSK